MNDSPVPDMYEKITEDSTLLGKIAGYIPGFSGYMERSRRRQADQILRQTMAGRLETARLQLANVHQDISRDMFTAIDHAEPLGRADTRLMGLIGKVKDAPQGYAGFFDAVKVKEDDLARLYEFDERILVHTEEIAASIAALEKAAQDQGDIGGCIRTLDRALQAANTSFASRQEVLAGVADK
jgi:hypothetical protein